jgi:hypothetical protein
LSWEELLREKFPIKNCSGQELFWTRIVRRRIVREIIFFGKNGPEKNRSQEELSGEELIRKELTVLRHVMLV